jgi:hypothetical protein
MIFASTVELLADSFMGLPDAHGMGKIMIPKSKVETTQCGVGLTQ